jgi:methylenetetrahydrofolate dehydrogenase (NADP+) / methenyltetrahydrofolate cyclohydrolase
MAARILDGAAIGRQIREDLAPRIAAFTARTGRAPGLGIVLVGNDPASQIYVRSKIKTGSETNLFAELIELPETATLDELLAVVARLNASPLHDGILVQSPLPKAMGPNAEITVFEAIDPAKDVDGFSPVNVGRLVQNRASLMGCTPVGVMEILRRSNLEIAGKHAVVIGRSDIVGKPMALMLLHANATVTICHSRTKDLPSIAREADILVAALGRTAFVTPDFVKPGATVIDVGINRVTDAAVVESLYPETSKRRETFKKNGSLVVGDVHPAVAEIAGAITPVPGGVGPLTIAMLLHNVIVAAEARESTTR